MKSTDLPQLLRSTLSTFFVKYCVENFKLAYDKLGLILSFRLFVFILICEFEELTKQNK